LKTAAVAAAGTGYFVTGSNAQESVSPKSPNERLRCACIGVGGKGRGDAQHAAQFGDIVAICDVDQKQISGIARDGKFEKAKQYADFREMLEKHGKEIDIVTVSGPDHMHAAASLMAMRMGKHVYTQKPLTRTIYEARKLAEVAKEMKVCTQMGNQGSSLNQSRIAIAQMKAGILGTVKEVHVWSNRPVWAQNPDRRMTLEKFREKAFKDAADKEQAEKLVQAKADEIKKALENLDWKLWLNTAPPREYFPGLYHTFQWRGWWDFGSGALGDMACHHMTVPFNAAGLKDPTWVRARTSGHDFDSFPASSTIEFEFPANAERGKIPFTWYDRKGNTPPKEIFVPFKINNVPSSGALIIGEKGCYFCEDDYGGRYRFIAGDGEPLPELPDVNDKVELAESKGDFDTNQMYELFRAVYANKPEICFSNFVDRAGPMTETILLGNLAVWAASKGSESGTSLGDWGEKIEWDAKNLVVTNLKDLKTPGVAELVKPVYQEGYKLD
jgi:predicted dehydrogenase